MSVYGMKVHQRGFYGSALAVTMNRQDPPDNYTNRPLDTPGITTFTANDAVVRVFANYVQSNYSSEDFDTIIGAIAVLVRAFGTNDLQTWHAQQYKSPTFGDNHVDFLEDCFKFAQTGRYQLDPFTWANILEPATTPAEQAELKQYTSAYLGKERIYPFSDKPTTVINLVADILSRNGGMDFLFNMVNTMFTGKR